jgi:hypothetical protein
MFAGTEEADLISCPLIIFASGVEENFLVQLMQPFVN